MITELRLRLPASADRDKAIASATASANKRAEDQVEDYEGEKAVRVAQSTVHHLQVRVSVTHFEQNHYILRLKDSFSMIMRSLHALYIVCYILSYMYLSFDDDRICLFSEYRPRYSLVNMQTKIV